MFSWLHRAQNFGLSFQMIVSLIVLSLLTTITEVFGIGIFLPIFQFMRLSGDLDALVLDSSFWQYVIDGFSYFDIEPSLAILLSISFIFFLTRQVFFYIRIVYHAAMFQRLIQIQRNRMFNRYLEADASFHDNMPVGKLVNIMTTEVNAAIVGVMAPMELMVYIIMLIGYLGMLLLLSWQMTLASIVVLIISSRVPNVWIRKSAQTGRKFVGANVLLSEFLVGRLRAPRLVRLAGTETLEKKEFSQLTKVQRKHGLFNSILQAKTNAVMEPIIITLSLVFLYFSYTVLHLNIEVIGIYLVISLRLIPTVKGIIKQWQNVQRHLGSIEVIEIHLKDMKESKEKDGGVKLADRLKNSILFNNVDYRYPTGKNVVLKNITIKIKAGAMTAIVGPSGSGKSTLIDLLPCLRFPISGEIKIDDESIKNYNLKSLRELIAYVPQSPQVFDGTIRSHILYGKTDATDEEVEEAISLSGVKEFIDHLPQGLETVLGEDAVKLSGGQRQRLDLARAIVRKAEILILDEPTSNLDAESEKTFKTALSRICEEVKTTIIIVSHNLASIKDADQIIVLNKGEIEATGLHDELLRGKGWYAKAWNIQSDF
jgi:ABC-type multidrug transport system fused ATPase/permease subunit